MPTRWVGIDEAGYGPNLGPLVMTRVVAESLDDQPPDLWNDLGPSVSRAGGDSSCLWVDDSKAIYRGGVGRERLDAACLSVLTAIGRAVPKTFGELLAALGAGTLDDVELTPWLDAEDPPWAPGIEPNRSLSTPAGASWTLIGARAVVLGPRRFNEGLAIGNSKARVHHDAFAQLLGPLWDEVVDTRVRSDKHGGRHFYHGPLSEIFPGAWIDRGVEGPALSHYTVRDSLRRLEIQFEPRADAADGLVALASIVSKAIREAWMDAFNAYWTRSIPGLHPTAGYPVDAARFRKAIEPACLARGMQPDSWWRFK